MDLHDQHRAGQPTKIKDWRSRDMHSVVELRDLKLETVIGSYHPDVVVPDHHLLDLMLSIDPSHVLINRDGMDVVFDYDPLVADIERIAAEIQYETQEWLVSRIVSVCADIPEIVALDILLRKAPVIGLTGSLGVRLVLHAEDLQRLRSSAELN